MWGEIRRQQAKLASHSAKRTNMMFDRRNLLRGSLYTVASTAFAESKTEIEHSGKSAVERTSTVTEKGNVRLINRRGDFWAQLDNTGTRGVGAEINALIEAHWEAGGVDLFLSPGTYLIETPIVVTRSDISIQGYGYGFSWWAGLKKDANVLDEYRSAIQTYNGGDMRATQGKTRLVIAPSCRDAIQVGPKCWVSAFSLHNITICGQNGRVGVRPDIHPEQNGIRIMSETLMASCLVDSCQLQHLTHGILGDHPESTIDVWYITDNWISECNVAIKLHASLFASVISRNGFHDMSGTVIELRGTNNTDLPTKEMVISDNTGWNPGKLVLDLEGFRGGTISDNAFMFEHSQVQCFARLRACHMMHVSGNTFVVDGDGPRTRSELGNGGQGYEQDGERYDTLTMAGCSDCTVSGNSLISFNRDRPVIRLGAHTVTGEKSHHNHIILNKVLPSVGFDSRPQIELTDGAEDNFVLLPMAVGARAWKAVTDHGSGNEICALPTLSGASSA
jgi:hypothetical protein